ncbi:MAG: tetratricopeptide repeat protein [Candidatus Glassbacteria bacterium]|nr:tetratricopeptide repeat protein [Candidatus Glassbacteria bacterium]
MNFNRSALTVSLYLLFLFSGVSALVYQAIWLRMFALVLGNSLHSAATVFAAFMGGLALGAWLVGSRIRLVSDRLRLYVLLETGVALSALAASWLIPQLHFLVAPAWHLLSGLPLLVDLFRVLLALAILLVPTALMGGTLPVLVAFTTSDVELSGRRVGAFYGWNTLGAVAGCALTGFWLLRTAGITSSLQFAVMLNLAVASLALLLRLLPRGLPEGIPASPPADKPPAPLLPANTRHLLLLAAGITGFAALAFEIVWARLLSYILHNDIYAYYLMLSTMLFGIGAGSLIYARWLGRFKDRLLLLAGMEIMLALSVIVCYLACAGLYLRDDSLLINTAVRELFVTLGAGPFVSMILLRLVYTLIAMLVPALLLGAIFPAVCAVYVSEPDNIGGQTGEVYAINTLGAISGSLLAGFLLISSVGVQGSLILISAVVLATGLWLLFHQRTVSGHATAIKRTAAAVAVTVFVVMAALPGNQVRRFALKDRPYTTPVFYREGLSGTVVVLEDRISGMRSLYINSIGEVENSFTGMQTFKVLGHLPLLLHEGEPRNVLMVTFGGGIASGAVAVHPIDRLDVVELEPAVVAAASSAYRTENRAVVEDPRVKIHLEDGRHYLAVTRDSYDVIISDATNPASVDSWLLYTVEFYRLCASRLNPGGVMAQWLPVHSGSPETYNTVVRTFQTVFPNTSIWQTKDYTVLAGTPAALDIDFPALRSALAEEHVAADLEPWCLDSPLELLDCFLMGPEGARRMSAGARVSTDDLPFYQFTGEQSGPHEILSMLEGNREPVTGYLSGLDSLSAAALDDSLRPYWRAEAYLLRRDFLSAARMNPASCKYARYRDDYLAEGDYYERMLSYAGDNYRVGLRTGMALAEHGRFGEARDLFGRLIEQSPDDPSIHSTLGNIEFKLENYRSAVRHYRTARRLGQENAALLINLGLALFSEGLDDEGMEALQQAVVVDPTSAEAHYYLGLGYGRLGEKQLELNQYKQALSKDPQHVESMLNLGIRYLEQRMFAEAGEMFSGALRTDPTLARAWRGLGIVMYAQGRAEQAVSSFRMALQYDPGDDRSRRYLEMIGEPE